MITYELVYERAQTYAPDVMRRYGLPLNKFSAEDVVGEFMVKFIEKGFLEKFDVTKGSFNYYVYRGLANAAISMVRHVKKEIASVEVIFPDSYLLPDHKHDYVDELALKFLIESVENFWFGYHEVIRIEDTLYDSSAQSVLTLMSHGYKKKEIAIFFSVSTSVIDNVIKLIRNQLREQKND